MTQEKSNFLLAITSVLSLAIACFALFSNGVPNSWKPEKVAVSTAEKIYLNHYSGKFQLNEVVSVINEGGTDIVLKDASFIFELENGKVIKLNSDSYQKIGDPIYTGNFYGGHSELPLSDVVIRPGSSWSGRLSFQEVLQREQQEARENLQSAAQKEAAKLSKRRNIEFSGLVSKYLSPAKIIAINNLDIQALFNRCDDASKELSDQSQKILDASLSRFTKGNHSVRFQLNSSDKILTARNRQLLVFEPQILTLNDLDFLAVRLCTNPNGNSSITLPQSGMQLELIKAK